MEPMPLALLAQRAPPLLLYFTAYPVQFLLAVMQPEVLIETAQHLRQPSLLSPSWPVHVSL